jgi:hypothetical protein
MAKLALGKFCQQFKPLLRVSVFSANADTLLGWKRNALSPREMIGIVNLIYRHTFLLIFKIHIRRVKM